MPLEVVLPYPVALITAAVSIYLSFQLYKRYRLKYLLYHLNYQIFVYFAHFLNAVGLPLALSLLTVENTGGKPLASYIFNPLICPLVVVVLYLFLKFAAAWLEVAIPHWFQRVFIGIWVVLLLFNTYTVVLNWLRGDPGDIFLLILSIWLIDTAGIVIWYLIVLFLVRCGRRIKDRSKQAVIRTYALIYFVGFVFLDIVTSKTLASSLGYPRGLLVNTLVFLVHLPPLFFLYRSIRIYYRQSTSQQSDSPDLLAFYMEHGISRREREIILLLMAGKSNQQIEAELFISLGTVKNHIYNIYQKLEVNTRLQLVSLMTKLGKGTP